MTRWFALGLILVCETVAFPQTKDVINDDSNPWSSRPVRPNSFGGGMVQIPQYLIAAQQKAIQPPPNPNAPQPQPQPPATPPAIRRPVRTTIVPTGPVKLDQHGDPLPPGALARYGSARLRHGPEPLGLGFSPDGKMLGSISPREDSIRLWDPKTGRELHRFNSPAS